MGSREKRDWENSKDSIELDSACCESLGISEHPHDHKIEETGL